ncbi:MAG: DNA primase, partial [Sulfurovaceae bacterium]|nr:DNA primase [Sulfurovaceae bacterium]
VLFPNGADPADMIAQNQIQEAKNLLENGQPLIPFVLQMTAKSYNLQNPKEKELAFEAIKVYLDSLSPILRDSYISHSATLLGVSPTLFGSSTKVENIKTRFSTPKDDVSQLSILKTVLENRDFTDILLEVGEPSIFGDYTSMLESIIKGDRDNPNLTGLMLDENIKIMQEDEFKQALASFLFRHYTKKLRTITSDNSISLIKKKFPYS